jgi:hypothetical protein
MGVIIIVMMMVLVNNLRIMLVRFITMKMRDNIVQQYCDVHA